MNDQRFPLAGAGAARLGASELFDLTPRQRQSAGEEIRLRAGLAGAEGLGQAPARSILGALGNLVPQLHIHVVARHMGDPAWPGPVWGAGSAVPHEKPGTGAGLGGFARRPSEVLAQALRGLTCKAESRAHAD